MRRRSRRMLAAGLLVGFVVLGTAVLLISNALVLVGTRGQITDRPDQAPQAQTAIVLGAKVQPDGQMSPMLADRVSTGARLYLEGKVDKVLASGDHGTRGYDEVNAMRQGLLDAGVPDRDIFTDHAGFDTWSSMVRAQKVFGVQSALVVTQGFHLPRAVWLGERAGLDVHGVASDLRGYGRQNGRSSVREWLARPKAVQEVAVGRDPQFLGPPIPITGDGRLSRG
ncbi:YdcF family protein [Svornostia abyssi]|uniref:YdcF family protein n=1 Tax=Svornostia abyssi TaxID=2898438 RepID=A0ABY5PCK4_9ACTN|nr:YdcF family protein [Parviterribacteraceae bacterium J379]